MRKNKRGRIIEPLGAIGEVMEPSKDLISELHRLSVLSDSRLINQNDGSRTLAQDGALNYTKSGRKERRVFLHKKFGNAIRTTTTINDSSYEPKLKS